jgi:four helix bundle protein
VAVGTFEDLLAWRLSYELKCEVFAFIATGAASRDFEYRDQIRASSASAPANISEGFGRRRPLDAARFYEISRSSLMETRNHLIDGSDRGYLDPVVYSRLSNLTRAALRTTTALWRSKLRQADCERAKRQIPRRPR